MAAPRTQGKLTVNDKQLAADIGRFYDDPLGYVRYVFPWGQKGTRLEKMTGPDDWQIDILDTIGVEVRTNPSKNFLPIQIAVASGHGIGKTALIAWIIHWFMSTRVRPQLPVTAGKKDQLIGKTWRELGKWNNLALNSHWYIWNATTFQHVVDPKVWYAHAIPWSANSPENFAGTHDENVLVIYDEASAIDDCIWEVTDGAMTTNGAMWIAFGNPTRTNGRFHQCFTKLKHRWITRQIDSRNAKMANRALLDQWVEDYGEDSDFVRVRVRGVFPRAGSLQFISSEDVFKAMHRKAVGFEALGRVLAVDIARHGDDESVACRRQGNNVLPFIRWRIADLMQLAARIAEVIDDYQPDLVLIDATGMGWGVVDRLHQMGYTTVIGVQVGEAANQPERFRDKRAELWFHMRTWIQNGGCLPLDNTLEGDLTQPEYGFDDKQRYVLESKKDMKARDLSSPDSADSLALSFTMPVAPTKKQRETWRDRLRKKARSKNRSAKAA